MTTYTTWQTETGGYIATPYASTIPATSGYAFFVGRGVQYRLDGFLASGSVYISRSGISSLPPGKYEMLPQVIDASNRIYFLTTADVEVERVLGTSSTNFTSGDSILVRLAALEAASGTGGGVTDHGSLTGLLDDDHPQYLTGVRASGLFSALDHTHTFASLTSKPTTISGYGITDALIVASGDARYARLASHNTFSKAQRIFADSDIFHTTIDNTDSSATLWLNETFSGLPAGNSATAFRNGITLESLFNLPAPGSVYEVGAAIDARVENVDGAVGNPGQLYGVRAFVNDANNTVGVGIEEIDGFSAQAYANGGNLVDVLQGFYVDASANGTGGASNIRGIRIDSYSNRTSVRSDNVYGIQIFGDSSSGPVTNAYGIRIGSMLNSSADNIYAIWTNGGQTRHVAGAATVTPLRLDLASNQSANAFEVRDDASIVLAGFTATGALLASSLPNHDHALATPSASGFMSATDKQNLDYLVASGLVTASGDARYAQLAVANTFITAQTITRSGIGTTRTDGLVIQNTTAAAAGAQQQTASLHFLAQGWKTNSTAGSQTIDFSIYALPVQGTTNPTGRLNFDFQVNGGGYNTQLYINSAGGILAGINSGGVASTVIYGVGDSGRGMFSAAGNQVDFAAGGAHIVAVTSAGITLGNSTKYGWVSGSNPGGSPTQDLGLGRNGVAVAEVNNGTLTQFGALKVGWRDSRTSTVASGLWIGGQSSGTPAAGFGIAQVFTLNSNTTADQLAAQIAASWSDATHASRTSKVTVATVASAGSLTDRIQLDAGNGANTTGFLLYDVNSTSLKRVEVGAADSGGTGYRLLRIAN